jgi:hypothetical protein
MPTKSKKAATKSEDKELHLIIIWENARHAEDKILADIDKKFKIIKTFEVHWTKNKFAENLSRFYGTLLPANSRKEVHVGTNPFLAVVVQDENPVYKTHTTSRGDKHVNTNLFTTKALHREWTGGGHRIHASNTRAEADHNLTLLFGKNSDDFLKTYGSKPSKKVEKWPHDPLGSDGWESLEQLFYVLNNTIDYVVLRNFDALPDKYYAKDHGDIDLLVSSYDDARFITNSTPVFKSKYRVYNNIVIGGEKVLFDFRNFDDNYYDTKWEQDILARRALTPEGFYVPAPEDHFYSLLYHAIIQKPAIGKDYIERLVTMAPEIGVKLTQRYFESDEAITLLSKFLLKNSYHFTQPNDKSVFFHTDNIHIGEKLGVKFSKKRINPFRNYLKKKKVPLKHYAAKSKRIARRYLRKLTPSK